MAKDKEDPPYPGMSEDNQATRVEKYKTQRDRARKNRLGKKYTKRKEDGAAKREELYNKVGKRNKKKKKKPPARRVDLSDEVQARLMERVGSKMGALNLGKGGVPAGGKIHTQER